MSMDQSQIDLWSFGLLVHGFPRDICPIEVASIVSSETSIAVKKIAPSSSVTTWFLFLSSHDDQKKCLQYHRTFSFRQNDKVYKIKLDLPQGKPTGNWISVDEDQDRMDSIASVSMFGSGTGSDEQDTHKPYDAHSPDKGFGQDRIHELYSPHKTGTAFGQDVCEAKSSPGPQNLLPRDTAQGGFSTYAQTHKNPGNWCHPEDLIDLFLQGTDPKVEESSYGRQQTGYPEFTHAQHQVHEQFGQDVFHGIPTCDSNPIYDANFKEGGAYGMGDSSFPMKDHHPTDQYCGLGYMESPPEENTYQSDFVVLPSPKYYLRVTDLPGTISEKELKDFFQDRRQSGGGTVTHVELDMSTKSAGVYFDDAEVIERVMRKIPLSLKGKKISVEPVSTESKEEMKEDEVKTVEVRGLPSEDSTDLCEMYFANPNNGGGLIESTKWVDHTKTFYMTFEDSKVANKVVSRGHTLKGNVLEVILSIPPVEEPQCTVEVRGIDPAKVDLYEMYFSNPNNGGDTIEEHSVNEDKTVVSITFETPEIAERVVAKRHIVKGRQLEVTLAPAKVKAPPPSTVMVKGFNPKKEEYFYQLYFENPNKGGGDIEDLRMDQENQAILITFKDPEVASRIIEREHKVAGCTLQVSLYTPKKEMPKRQTSCETPSEEKGAQSRSVVLTIGQHPTLTKDTYQFHFESPKHGGGEVESCDIDREKNLVFITFVSSEVAARVAKEKHIISGHPYEVKLYIPKETYPDKLLFKNVADNTSQTTLHLYLEKATGLEVKDILYADEVGKILATFLGKPDLASVNQFCQNRTLEGRILTAFRVPISDCILVENISNITTKDTLWLYFEHRNSRGGPVENVEMIQEENKCIVQFKDWKVLDQVLHQQHRLDGDQLVVKRYMECLGLSGGSSDPTAFSVPKPIVLDNVDPYKIAFLRQSPEAKDGLVDQLLPKHAQVIFSGGSLTIECSLKKSDPKARILARTWTVDVQQSASSFLDMIDIHRRNVVQQIWPEVEKMVSSANLPDIKGAMKFSVADESTFVVVGLKSMAQDLFMEIDRLAKGVEAEIERKNQEVTETNSKLPPYKLRLLIAISFQYEAKKRHSDVTISIDIKKNCIVFHGLFKDVKNAEVDMYDVLQTVKGEKLTDLTEMQRKILDNKETKPLIVQKFKSEHIVAVWEVGQNEDVIVYAFSDEELVKAVHILKKSVCQHVCQLNSGSYQLIHTSEWQSLQTYLTDGHRGVLLMAPSQNNQQIVITAIDSVVHAVVEEVEKFLLENTIYSQTVCFSESRQEFINFNWQHKLKDIMHDLREHKVQINMKDSGTEIYVKGTAQGLAEVKRKLEQLDDQILCQSKTFNSQDYVTFLKSKCEKDLVMVGHSSHCVLKLHSDPSGLKISQSDEQRGVVPVQSSEGTRTVSRAVLPSGVALAVVQGDITQITVDAIVNAANTRLDHVGGLARHIVEKGGDDIQKECHNALKQRGGDQLQEADVLVTKSGKLPCKVIIHAVGPIYNGGRSGEEETLFDTITRCLAISDANRYSSIAFPALSTGIFRYPVADATRVIVEAVQQFFVQHKRSPIRDIIFCHFEENVTHLFSQAVQRIFPATKQGPTAGAGATKKAADTTYRKQLSVKPAGKNTKPQSLKLKAAIVKGEIAKQTADVIVNSTSNHLELRNGAVSGSILKAAGGGLQQECTTNYPQGIESSDIACTAGHGLSCTEVFHLALLNYSNPAATQILGNVMTKCLMEASKKKYKSIAFPVLGTGNLGFPPHIAAQTMLDAIAQFQANNKATSLSDIRIVVYPSDTNNLQEFQRVHGSMSTGTRAVAAATRQNIRQSRVFETGGESTANRAARPGHAATRGSTANCAEFDFRNLRLVIKQGDITVEDTEAIVNSTNSQLDLTRGGVATVLRKKCGTVLEDACQKKVTEIQQDGVTMTPSFGLNCKLILHVDVQKFQEDIEESIKSCLNLAEKWGTQSIALPALGTGIGVTAHQSASALFEAVVNMYSRKKGSVEEIRVVLYDQPTYTQFVQTVQDKGEQWSASRTGFFSSIKSAITGSSESSFKQVDSSHQVSATVYVYGERQEDIDASWRLLETIVRDKFHVQKYPHVPELHPDEVQLIQQVGNVHSVSLEINETSHVITCSGQAKDVFECMQQIYSMIREIETKKAQKETASILANVVEWCFLEVTSTGTEVKPYGLQENRVIETAFQKKEMTVEITDLANHVYIIDFDKWEEYLRDDPSDVVSVIRRDKNKDTAFGQLPPEWEKHTPDETMKEVPLNATSKEFLDVQKHFTDTGADPNLQILSIARVQNPHLYHLFATKKAHLDKQNPGQQNERKLWHGTSVDAIQNINHHGFNRSYCGKNAVAYGQGVYFAVNARYSVQTTYSPADATGTRHLYLCRVLAGVCTKGSSDLRVLPPRKGEILYDSATDNPANPNMYVIFNDTQAYPEYLIRFK